MDFGLANIQRDTYLKLTVIPVLLLLFSISSLFYTYSQEGVFLHKSIELEGGTQLTIHYSEHTDTKGLEDFLSEKLKTSEASVLTTTNPATRKQETLIVSVGGEQNADEVKSAVEEFLKLNLEPTKYSAKILGPALASTFWSQAKWAFALAFLFMALIVIFYFRRLATSATILLSMSADMVAMLGFMSLFEIPISLATIAAMLMILGYGVDSNILLANKIVKEKEGEPLERVKRALKTGMTMSATTISALAALFLISNSIVLKQISGVLLIGLVTDFVNTWILNANLLLWRIKS